MRGAAPETTFLVLGGVFGLFFALATPPHDPADEVRHHARAQLIAEGRFGVVGEAPGHQASVPRSIVELHPAGHHYSAARLRSGRVPRVGPLAQPHRLEELRGLLGRPFAAQDRVQVRYVTAYNPLVSLPAAAALCVARGLDLSALAGLYLARIASLACWWLGVWIVLRRARSQRWLIASVALLPMSVFQAGSVSADPLTQVACLLLFAELLRGLDPRTGAFQTPERVRLLAASLLLGIVKLGYAPLVLAGIGIPEARLPGRRKRVLLAGMLGAAVVPTLLWAWVVAAAQQPSLTAGADPAAQLRQVLLHPFDFLAAVGRTIGAALPAWVEGLVGDLGHLDVQLPLAATALGVAVLVVSAGLDRERVEISRSARLGLLAAFGATSLLLLVLAYLGWTAVGSPVIQGVQGRYFLPMLPFALASLPVLPRTAGLVPALPWALAALLVVAAVELVDRYYAI